MCVLNQNLETDFMHGCLINVENEVYEGYFIPCLFKKHLFKTSNMCRKYCCITVVNEF